MPPGEEEGALWGYTLLGGGAALWSTIEVASKYLGETFTPTAIAILRFALSALILLPLFLNALRRDKSLGRRVWKKRHSLLSLGLLGITGTFLLYHLSLDYISASSAAVIVSSVPVFVAIFSALIFGEYFSRIKKLGVVGGLLGLLILLLSRGGFSYSPLGYTMILSATLLFSIYTALSHPLMKSMGASAFTSTTLVIGTLGLLPFLFIPTGEGAFRGTPGLGEIIVILYLGVVATGGGYILYFAGLSRVNPGAGSSLLFLKPPLSATLAVIFLGERVTLPLLLSVVIISLSIYLVIFSPQKEPEKEEDPQGDGHK